MGKDLKKTYTYYGSESIRSKAIKKAEKEGLSFSELVDSLLLLYGKSKKGSLLQTIEKRTVLHFGSEQYEMK